MEKANQLILVLQLGPMLTPNSTLFGMRSGGLFYLGAKNLPVLLMRCLMLKTQSDMNNKAINIRITAELRDKLKAAAKAAGMPVSVFLRIVLTRIVKP